MSRLQVWIYGFFAAVIGAASSAANTALAAMVIDPEHFNFGTGFVPMIKIVGWVAAFEAIKAAALYLKQSPLPMLDQAQKAIPIPNADKAALWILAVIGSMWMLLHSSDAIASARSFKPQEPALACVIDGGIIMRCEHAEIVRTSTSGWTYDFHAGIAAVYLDGGATDVLHVGPAACVGYALGAVTPELCGSASLVHGAGATFGTVGMQVLFEVPFVQAALGIPAPAFGFGWDFLRLGDGGGFGGDSRAFYLALDASVLGL